MEAFGTARDLYASAVDATGDEMGAQIDEQRGVNVNGVIFKLNGVTTDKCMPRDLSMHFSAANGLANVRSKRGFVGADIASIDCGAGAAFTATCSRVQDDQKIIVYNISKADRLAVKHRELDDDERVR